MELLTVGSIFGIDRPLLVGFGRKFFRIVSSVLHSFVLVYKIPSGSRTLIGQDRTSGRTYAYARK